MILDMLVPIGDCLVNVNLAEQVAESQRKLDAHYARWLALPEPREPWLSYFKREWD